MRILPVVAALLFSSCLQSPAQREARPMMLHTVAFTLAEGHVASAGNLVESLEQELSPLPGVVNLYAGLRGEQFKRPTNLQDFHVLLVVGFRDSAAYEEYLVHPVHLRLVESWAPRLSKIAILDALRVYWEPRIPE